KRQPLAVLVNLRVSRGVLCAKCLIGLARFPLVDRQVDALPPNLAQQPSAAIARVAPEQLHPLALPAVYLLKQYLTSRLDFELPESYKQSCPISCFSDVGNPFEEPEILELYTLPRRV